MTLEVTSPDDCDQDSTYITLYNTEPDVKYHLIDVNSNQLPIMDIDGNCDSIEFGIGPLQEPTSFKIQAENLITNCTVILDTSIQVLPYSKYIYVDNTFNLCEGDSALVRGNYIYSNAVFTDTIFSFGFCDTIIQNSYFFAPYPNINLGKDTTLCMGDMLTLDVREDIGNYTWQDNSTNST